MLLVALDGSISRYDGLLLFGCLVAYVVWLVIESRRQGLTVEPGQEVGDVEEAKAVGYLVLDASGVELMTFQRIMLGFVLPLTTITLIIGVSRALRSRGRKTNGRGPAGATRGVSGE